MPPTAKRPHDETKGSNNKNNDDKRNRKKQRLQLERSYHRLLQRPRDSRTVSALMDFVKANPSMALQGNITPLQVLIESSAELQIIQGFCKDFPSAVQSKSSGFVGAQFPVELACFNFYKVARGVIPFLCNASRPFMDNHIVWGERLLTSLHRMLHYIPFTGDDTVNDTGAGASNERQKKLEDVQAVVQALGRTGIFKACVRGKPHQANVLYWALYGSNCDYGNLLETLLPFCSDVRRLTFTRQSFTQRAQGLSCGMAKLVPQLTHLDLYVGWSVQDQHAWRRLIVAALGQDANQLQSLKLILWKNAAPVGLTPAWIFTTIFESLSQSTSFPTLRELVLDTRPTLGGSSMNDLGVTGALENLLRKNVLQDLTVINFFPQHERVFDALQGNTSLKHMKIPSCTDTQPKHEALRDRMMRYNNTSLLNISGLPSSPSPVSHWIEHRCRLNRKGLGTAQNPATTIAKLLELVAAAMEDNWGFRISGDTSAGYAYALLRQCPTIWCGGDSTMARRLRAPSS